MSKKDTCSAYVRTQEVSVITNKLYLLMSLSNKNFKNIWAYLCYLITTNQLSIKNMKKCTRKWSFGASYLKGEDWYVEFMWSRKKRKRTRLLMAPSISPKMLTKDLNSTFLDAVFVHLKSDVLDSHWVSLGKSHHLPAYSQFWSFFSHHLWYWLMTTDILSQRTLAS